MKKHKIKITPKLRKLLLDYMRMWKVVEGEYWEIVMRLQETMARETGIPDIEFIFVDGEFAGVGNASRTMPLVQMKGA